MYLTRSLVYRIALPVLIVSCFYMQAFPQSTPPNIIYIMTDDMGYADLSGFGGKEFQTPNIDKLAAQGIKFTNAYSAGAVCTPTRTAFMTGRYPAKTPIGLKEPLTELSKDSAFGLTPEFPSLPGLLKSKGYTTALIGKWHLGFLEGNNPIKNGFDYFYGFHSGGIDYISHKGAGRHPDLYLNDKLVDDEGYLTEMFTKKSIEYIQQIHRKPFFLSINFNAPHWPWIGPGDKAYSDTVGFRMGGSKTIYAAMMKSLDDAVGQLIQAIDQAGLSTNTLVIFTNDNGGEKYSNMGEFAKGKGSLWEGGIRVPAIVRWPGKIRAGQVTDQAAITMDWSATILAVGKADADKKFPLDGMNLLPLCMERVKPVDRTFFWRTFQRMQQKAVRQGKWKYLKDENGEYLFNLKDDEGEKKDMKLKEQEIFLSLKSLFTQWEKQVLMPIPL
jgi:arylsulfatase A-like enzyme